MKILILTILILFTPLLYATEITEHKMQHGFILSSNDSFASHLVANSHHSRQTNITGGLIIHRWGEELSYKNAKEDETFYFVFQAQNLDLSTISEGQILKGHIIQSKKGQYSPKAVIVNNASFYVNKVLLNIENPFFGSP